MTRDPIEWPRDLPVPMCPVCKDLDGGALPLVYRVSTMSGRGFFGCRNYLKHPPERKIYIDAADWRERLARSPQVRARVQRVPR